MTIYECMLIISTVWEFYLPALQYPPFIISLSEHKSAVCISGDLRVWLCVCVNRQEFTLSMLLKPGEKTYTQRCRLFIGNLPNDITEEDFKRLFAKYGEPSEVFINKGKGFGFIRLVRHPIFVIKYTNNISGKVLNIVKSYEIVKSVYLGCIEA